MTRFYRKVLHEHHRDIFSLRTAPTWGVDREELLPGMTAVMLNVAGLVVETVLVAALFACVATARSSPHPAP